MERKALLEALGLLDKVRIEPGRENRMRMATAEQKIMSCIAQMDKKEKEAQEHGKDHDEQGAGRAG